MHNKKDWVQHKTTAEQEIPDDLQNDGALHAGWVMSADWPPQHMHEPGTYRASLASFGWRCVARLVGCDDVIITCISHHNLNWQVQIRLSSFFLAGGVSLPTCCAALTPYDGCLHGARVDFYWHIRGWRVLASSIATLIKVCWFGILAVSGRMTFAMGNVHGLGNHAVALREGFLMRPGLPPKELVENVSIHLHQASRQGQTLPHGTW